MPLARVVSFDGVSSDRIAEMQREMEGSERPENVPAKEIVVLHDPEGEKSLVILFFDTDASRAVVSVTFPNTCAGMALTPEPRGAEPPCESRRAL